MALWLSYWNTEIKLGSFLHFLNSTYNQWLLNPFLQSRKMRSARTRRPAARRSYRSSFISSGSARRIASAERSGLVVGIAGASTRFGGIISPRRRPLKNRLISPDDGTAAGVSSPPKAITHEISAALTRRICARSNSASAIVRAHSRATVLVLTPAILRANRSICLMRSAVAVTPAARPCRKEFRLDRFLPATERGPCCAVHCDDWWQSVGR
jgi:hypothetical protein